MSLLSSFPRSTPPVARYHPLLRHSERVLAAQSCRVRSSQHAFLPAEVLLVVSDTPNGQQAAVFILPCDDPPAILYIIPLMSGFTHKLEQTPPSPSTSFFHQSAKPHITLYISFESTKLELRIAANQSAKVQNLVAEFRRLNDITANTLCPPTLSHAWVDLYPVEAPSQESAVDELAVPDVSISSGATPPIASSSSASDLDLTSSEDTDPYSPTFSRHSFLRSRLFSLLPSWSITVPLKIRCATYNVNDKVPPQGTKELGGLVGDGSDDLIVVGLQEAADLRRQALLLSQGNSRADSWEAALFNGLGDKAVEFEKLIMTQYVGVVMILLVRKTLRMHVSRIETSERGIGLLGFGGNKAGVAVRLKIHDTTLCFVNSHLAAFTTAIDRRRLDYATLRTGLTFPRPPLIPNSNTETNPEENSARQDVVNAVFEEFWPEVRDKLLTLEDCNALFWMGDLNFRTNLPDDKVLQLVDDEDWTGILEHDQLKGDINEEKSFVGFQEPFINFPPTFKYVHGSSTLDTKRAPSYTDRILYTLPSSTLTSPTSLSPAPTITPSEYKSHPVFWSDHRPVSCTFSMTIRKVDFEKRKEMLSQVQKELDRLEWAWRPSLEIEILDDDSKEPQGLERESIEFGEMRVRTKKVRKVRLRNGGKVPATFSFRAPGPDKPICKPFIWPYPCSGTVPPEGEWILKVVADVDELWASRLTLGSEDANDVLVLQVDGGKDTFLPLSSTFLPSTISLSLSTLSLLSKPIRDLSLSERKILARPFVKSETNRDGSSGFKAVNEVWKMLEYLMTKPPSVDMWIREGSVEDLREVLRVLECLDSGLALSFDKPQAIINALIYFLASLPGGLLPEEVQNVVDQGSVEKEGCFGVLEGVGKVITNVLIGLMSVVRLSLGQAEESLERQSETHIDIQQGDDQVKDISEKSKSLANSTPVKATSAKSNTSGSTDSVREIREKYGEQQKAKAKDDLKMDEGGVFELGDDEDEDDKSTMVVADSIPVAAEALPDCPKDETIGNNDDSQKTVTTEENTLPDEPTKDRRVLQPAADIVPSLSPRKQSGSIGAASFTSVPLSIPPPEDEERLRETQEVSIRIENVRIDIEDAPKTKEIKEQHQAIDAEQRRKDLLKKLVDVLLPAIFGRSQPLTAAKEKRREFVRLLLEG
nr:hypothetical protein L203_06319 [Cryptococcus depauperatus CBS 7841]